MRTAPEIGQLVVVRRRPFVVTGVKTQGIHGGGLEQQDLSHLVKLSSVEDDSLGEELEIIWDLEPGAAIHERSSLPEPELTTRS